MLTMRKILAHYQNTILLILLCNMRTRVPTLHCNSSQNISSVAQVKKWTLLHIVEHDKFYVYDKHLFIIINREACVCV